jgi:hypothetical protein
MHWTKWIIKYQSNAIRGANGFIAIVASVVGGQDRIVEYLFSLISCGYGA